MADKRQKNSVFTREQEIFIVEQFVLLKSATKVKRAFTKKFKESVNSRWLWKLKPCRFKEVYQRFQAQGVSPKKSENPRHERGTDRSDPDKAQQITDYFMENQMNSIFDASKALKIPESTIQWYLKHKIKLKPYKLSLAQILTKAHKDGRLAFCQWLLSLPPEFVDLVIFGDEKWFHLTQHPNRQNTRIWAFVNPHKVSETNVQGCAKVQAFVCVVDGRVLPVIWHVDEEGKNVTVNTARYMEVVKEVVSHLPPRKLKKYWWQQDGATCHTSHKSLEELKKHFGARIISKRSAIEWPARSPDLNPLDYSFWGMAMKKVWEENPKTLDDLKTVVEDFFSSLPEDLVRRTVANIRKRAELCVKNNGGHFESEL